jgi:isoleucyl-tRNA synthetase
MEFINYAHPLYERKSPVIIAEYVEEGDGTGLVHNAPGFGNDDYFACMKYGIKPYAPIDNYGKFTSEVNDATLIGVFYEDANKIITERLTACNALLNLSFFTHSVAHD